jgi:hypothetical protein
VSLGRLLRGGDGQLDTAFTHQDLSKSTKHLPLIGTTYLCDATLSKMKYIKHKHTTKLTYRTIDLDHCIRLASD